ncbi:class I SAM-dependent methyltransferase [candidate division WOR-3 bacterium]|nr:class I SAM-dependent methyltransferase [candidate division WOR-3 bacterium]
MRDFLNLCRPNADESVLDVGVLGMEGYQAANFFLRAYPHPEKLTALSIEECGGLRTKYPLVRFVTYDGRRFPFPDKSFDVCHSNAVVEHVGNADQQRLFVSEMIRVARRGFFTTPNRWFPVELHTKIPLLHYLPWPVFLFVCRLVHRGENIRGVRLLGRRQLKSLVEAAHVTKFSLSENRLLGLAVTYSVYWSE